MRVRGLVLLLLAAGCRQVLGLEAPSRTVDAAHDTVLDSTIDAAVDAAPDAPPGSGSLMATVVAFGSGDVNLTGEGTTDWAHWGYGGATSFDHKAFGGAISDATATGAAKMQVMSVSATASWTDGMPDVAVSMSGTAIGVISPGVLSFTVPAGVMPHTLKVYTGNKLSTERLDVSLSDGSAPPYMNSQASSGATGTHYAYTIVYRAARDGETLTVTWTDTVDQPGGFAMLLSATLQ